MSSKKKSEDENNAATVVKYGNFFYYNLDKDNPIRQGNTLGKKTSRSDYEKPIPDWLPDPLKEEIKWTVFKLQENYTYDQIFNFIARREGLSLLASQQVSDDVKDKIDALIYIQRLIELGREKGIKAYLGEGSEKVYRSIVESEKQSHIASKSRESEINKKIKEILEVDILLSAKQIWAKVAGSGINIETFSDSAFNSKVSRIRKKIKEN